MDQITESLVRKMNLSSGETDLVAANPSQAATPRADQDFSLIGRVIIDREIPFNAIRGNVLRLIHPMKGATLRILAPNKFMVQFNHALDRQKAM